MVFILSPAQVPVDSIIRAASPGKKASKWGCSWFGPHVPPADLTHSWSRAFDVRCDRQGRLAEDATFEPGTRIAMAGAMFNASTIVFRLLVTSFPCVAVACGGSTEPAGQGAPVTGGTGGTGDSGVAGGTGGTGGTQAAGSGGTGGTVTDDAGMTGTRCDNGIGAGGDGCADNFPTDDTMGFKIAPGHLATGVDPQSSILVSGQSFYTIPEQALTTLQGASLVSLSTGVPVDAQGSWTDSLTWDWHAVQLEIEPSEPLAEGWYAVQLEGDLTTGHNTPVRIPAFGGGFRSVLRVGSWPLWLGVEACDERVTLRFSEVVDVPDSLPVTVVGQGQELACVREVEPGQQASPALSIELTCAGLDSWQATDVVIDPGLVSPSGVPLRNAAGEQAMVVSLPGQSGCRLWEETELPQE